MDALRIAIVGCGRMGRERAFATAQLGATVVTVCDSHGPAAEALAADIPGCQAIEHAGALAWDTLDAILICTPLFARGGIELAAIERGVPVFVEKPIGLSAQQSRQVLYALPQRPVVTAVGYMNRYRESVWQARRRLADQPILGVSCHWVVGVYHVPWWRQSQLSGGPVNEQATHVVDLARYLIGDITAVQAIAQPLDGDERCVGTASFNLHFANGVLGSFFYSCQAFDKMIDFQVFTPESSVHLHGWDFRLLDPTAPGPPPLTESDRGEIFRTELAAFFEAITTGSTHAIRCDYAEAIKTQRVVDTLNCAVQSGCLERV